MKRVWLLSVALAGAAAGDAPSAAPLPLVPAPVSVERGAGGFAFGSTTVIRHDAALLGEARLFAADLAKRTGVPPKLVAGGAAADGEIFLHTDAIAADAAGGYRLEITPHRIVITGRDAAGAFYGTRDILQLLPPAGDAAWKTAQPVNLPAVRIADRPRYAWRGMMLDCGRFFHSKADVEEFLDWLAFHKLNVFHWHLTEDQGWRIEIRKYPKLTTVGAWRDSSPPYGNRQGSDGTRHGGFYTQAEIREVAAYAAARHITIVPEIEMPGHASAAIASYPEFGNTDVPGYNPRVQTTWGVHPYIFAPREETFRFLEDVLTEVCELFPASPYIHIGGDEAPKDQWKRSKAAQEVIKREKLKDEFELQSWFVRRMAKFLESKHRRLIGWDEIQEGGLPKSATMMVWRDTRWAKHALAQGNQVVMAPNSHTYLDHYQLPGGPELAKGPFYEAIGGYLPVENVYSFNPGSVVEKPEQEKQVLGVQGQLWSEYFHDWKKVQYMTFPRIAAIAEIGWTPQANRDCGNFLVRLQGVMGHYDAAGVFYARPPRPAVRTCADGASVTTSFGFHAGNWPELAFDGRNDTFFWADRPPHEGDHLTVRLRAPLAAETPVSVATGGPESHNGDKLEHGVLEAETTPGQWSKVADFQDGTASGRLPKGSAAFRLRVLAGQTNWLILHEAHLGN